MYNLLREFFVSQSSNSPSKSEPWKAPVSVWLHEIEAKHQKKAAQKQRRRAKTKQAEAAPDTKETP